jgi:mRNA interferase RelE/StbE
MYSLLFDRKAVKELSKIDKPFQRIIKGKLELLATNPEVLKNDIKILRGKIPNLYRLRVGNYRIIYRQDNDKLIILIVRIGHRKDIYD